MASQRPLSHSWGLPGASLEGRLKRYGTELLLTPPRAYRFVAAAGEAAEAPDRHLQAATLGHDAGRVQLLKE